VQQPENATVREEPEAKNVLGQAEKFKTPKTTKIESF
jgi:hypothetical protein